MSDVHTALEAAIPDAVYWAAMDAYLDALGAGLEEGAVRAAVDAVAPLLIAEGRRQAARQIIARDGAEGDWDVNVAYWAAVRIAEGTDA